MIILKLQFFEQLAIPGIKAVTSIEPADDAWKGWQWFVEKDRIVGLAPLGWLGADGRTVPAFTEREIRAQGMDAVQARFVVSEPLHRVRIYALDDGAAGAWRGPSDECAKVHALPPVPVRAPEPERDLTPEEERLARKRSEIQLARDKGKAHKDKMESRRPPWYKPPVEPPPPVDEEVP